jgi:hypothetical protein
MAPAPVVEHTLYRNTEAKPNRPAKFKIMKSLMIGYVILVLKPVDGSSMIADNSCCAHTFYWTT